MPHLRLASFGLPILVPMLVAFGGCRTDEPTIPPVAPERPRDAAAKADRATSTPPATNPTPPPSQPSVDMSIGAPAEPGTASDAGPQPVSDAGPTADAEGDAAPATGGDGGATTPPGMEATWSHTMCDKKALMFPKIDKNNGVFPIGSCPPPESLNRACGGNSKIKVAAAEAQTFETGYVHPPGYAIDEYIMTRWSSHTMMTSWIMFDLGSEQSFKRLYLAWEVAHASDYDIVTSNDKTTWTMLKQVRGGDGYQDILDVEGKARYVRMNGIKRGVIGPGMGPYGYSLFDFTVCGDRP